MENIPGNPEKRITRERFAAVIVGGEETRELESSLNSVGWLEFRVDSFLKKYPNGDIYGWLSMPLPPTHKKIATLRWHKESGNNGLRMHENRRLEIYEKLLNYADYADIEASSRISGEVIKTARAKKRKIIVSFHDFHKTGSPERLKKIFTAAIRLRPDIIKVATRVNSEKELFNLLSFTHKYSKKHPLVVAPMGVSIIERVMPLYLGSLFTYVSLKEQTAPGQPSLKQIAILKKEWMQP